MLFERDKFMKEGTFMPGCSVDTETDEIICRGKIRDPNNPAKTIAKFSEENPARFKKRADGRLVTISTGDATMLELKELKKVLVKELGV